MAFPILKLSNSLNAIRLESHRLEMMDFILLNTPTLYRTWLSLNRLAPNQYGITA